MSRYSCGRTPQRKRETYGTADTRVASSVRVLLVAHEGLRVIRTRETLLEKGRVSLVEEAPLGQVPAQAVIGRVARLVDVQGQVRERAVRDTGVRPRPVAAEARVRVEDGGPAEADSPGLDGGVVSLLIPVGLGAGVAALGLEQELMYAHVQTVPGEEGADVVDDVGLGYVNVLQLVPARLGVLDAAPGRRGLQAELCVDICLFLGI